MSLDQDINKLANIDPVYATNMLGTIEINKKIILDIMRNANIDRLLIEFYGELKRATAEDIYNFELGQACLNKEQTEIVRKAANEMLALLSDGTSNIEGLIDIKNGKFNISFKEIKSFTW